MDNERDRDPSNERIASGIYYRVRYQDLYRRIYYRPRYSLC